MTVASTGGKYGSSNGIRAHAGSIDTDVAASRPYGGLRGDRQRGSQQQEAGGLPRRGGARQLRPERLDPFAQLRLGQRRVGYAECPCDTGGIGHIPVAAALVEGVGAVELMGEQEAVDLGDVHPFQEVRVRGAVRPAVGGDPVDTLVDPAHPVHRALRVGGGAERRHREERTGALQPAPRITAVVGVLGDARHRQRVKRLEQQRAQPADEHGGIGVHPPDRPVFAEPARARRLVDARPVGGPSGPATMPNRLRPRVWRTAPRSGNTVMPLTVRELIGGFAV